MEDNKTPEEKEEKPFLSVIVHSFFIIPFLIAVFCILLFTSINLLTSEKRSVYDYLEDVKTGGLTKRWQGAFELSKILSNPDMMPTEERFVNEMNLAFSKASHDDDRVRQYLALAMGRTKNDSFIKTLTDGLKEEKEANIPSLLYALGMIQDKKAISSIAEFIDHPNARIRSIAVAAIGNIADEDSIDLLKGTLRDPEANVQWSSAIALAQLGDNSGKDVLLKLLYRPYYDNFNEVDVHEQDQMILTAIESTRNIIDEALKDRLSELAKNDQNMNIRSSALSVINTK